MDTMQWNGVVAATFLTRQHILVLKSHSLEICTLLVGPQFRMQQDATRQMSAAVHSHFFPGTTFRGVSFSRSVVHSPELQSHHNADSTPLTTVSLSFLAYDVLRGLFYCTVSVTIPHDSMSSQVMLPPIDVQVRLLAAHNMALPVTPGTAAEGAHPPRSGFSTGARGFVSACALGPAGRRGVWVERRRGAVRRVVYGFSTNPPDSDDEDDGVDFVGGAPSSTSAPTEKQKRRKLKEKETGKNSQGFQPGTPLPVRNAEVDADSTPSGWNAQEPRAIEGKEVYDVNSYDLRGALFPTLVPSVPFPNEIDCAR